MGVQLYQYVSRRPTSIASVLNIAKNPSPVLNFMKKIEIYDEIET